MCISRMEQNRQNSGLDEIISSCFAAPMVLMMICISSHSVGSFFVCERARPR